MKKTKTDLKNKGIVFILNLKIYPLEAVRNAAYAFADRAFIDLKGNSKKEINVFLKSKNKLTGKQIKDLKGEFLNELLNCSIRKNIFDKKRKILEYVVAGAVTAALEKPKIEPNNKKENKEMLEIEKEIAALQQELEKEADQDYQIDPLEIAKPYGKSSKKRK
ncbi:His-Xaa-Ser system protein HxsD [Patescibacteria group bacterium]|nr:His-Xaa-Ser system protein HxsD [Patescibacteria group bacterium]